jgi:hypothetical protein
VKNTNEGFLDFLKKDKAQTAEQFFEIDRMGSKGAKGVILKMLDVMTPDSNIEYQGAGKEQGDAIGYVQDYVKKSFLGMIDARRDRGDNENADFAQYMDSEAWGENINFDTLIEATKELYELSGDFLDELQTGSETESKQSSLVTLGVNTIPVALLFHCLRYLGKSLVKMRKRYKNKRMTNTMSESIIENYIKTEGLLDYFKLGSAKDVNVQQLRQGLKVCTPRGAFEVHKIYDGECLSVTDIKKREAAKAAAEKAALQETTEKTFEETSYGQMVADAINQVVSEMPEIKLGLAVLAEQDDDDLKASVQELGRTEALNIMTAFKAKIAADLQETLDEVLREQGYTT